MHVRCSVDKCPLCADLCVGISHLLSACKGVSDLRHSWFTASGTSGLSWDELKLHLFADRVSFCDDSDGALSEARIFSVGASARRVAQHLIQEVRLHADIEKLVHDAAALAA